MISLEYFLEVAISYLLIAFFQIKNPADAGFFMMQSYILDKIESRT